tara:strand:- start:39 stop:566 length:528 start_codon:yes stop_codon:yes gene_type:complete
MPDYSKGLIYTIKTGNSIYVGSTTNFTKRKHQHKVVIKANIDNTKLYSTIRENGEWDIKPYKEFPCENKTQLTIEEERVRCDLKADLNMKCCGGQDRKKYLKDNEEHTRKRQKIYNETNKNIIKENCKKYYENNKDKILEHYKKKVTCECGCLVRLAGLQEHKRTKKHLDKIKDK